MSDETGSLRALRVLLLEDQESDALLMVHELHKAGCLLSWKRVDNERDYRAELEDGSYDVILSDYTLPSFNAQNALSLYREKKLNIPFIVVTGSLGEEQAVELMKMGASDYLIKDRLARLGGAVSAAMEQKRLRDDNHEALIRLKASEERFRRIAENAQDVIFRFKFKPDVQFEYLSPSVEKMLGYPVSEFLSNPALAKEIIHPDDRYVMDSGFSPEHFVKEPFVLRCRHKNGSMVWIELRGSFIFDESGLPSALDGIARDMTETYLREREREAMISVATALRDTMMRAEIIPIVLKQVTNLLKADGAALGKRDRGGNLLQVEMGLGAWQGWQGTRIDLGQEITQQVLVENKPYINPDVRKRPAGTSPLWNSGMRSVICMPLQAQNQVMGILWLGFIDKIHEQERSMRLLTAIADIAASSLHRASLHEEMEQRVQHLTALRTIDRAITSSLDLHLTMNVLLDQLMGQRGVDAADILLLDPYTYQLNFRAGRGFRGRVIEGSRHRTSESLAGQVVMERRILSIQKLEEHPLSNKQKDMLLAEGFHTYLGLPLISKGEVLGVLEIMRRVPRDFDQDWLDFVEALAGQVAIAINNAEMYEKLQRTYDEVIKALDDTLDGWSRALDTRNLANSGHSQRVVWWTLALGRALGVPDSELIHLRRGARLHDIGKLALPDSILKKPGPLTEEERTLMRKHPVYAFEWLSPIFYLQPALDIPYCHHEAWDGSGYPRGLKGHEIPLPGRIFAIVDAWDSLRSDRPFRKAWPREKALEYIREMSGKLYDPEIVSIFLQLVDSEPQGFMDGAA